MANTIIGTILLQAANQSGGITGSGAPSMPGMGGSSADNASRRTQKEIRDNVQQQTDAAEKQPKLLQTIFKKAGIQVGLAGILKQSQIFTSTIGSLFQIFGAFVDVMLAPFVPLFIPAIRWLARQLPTVAKGAAWVADQLHKVISKAWDWFFGGKFKENIKGLFTGLWDNISGGFSTVIDFFKNMGTNIMTNVLKPLWEVLREGMRTAWNSTLGGQKILRWTIPNWGGGGGGGTPEMPSSQSPSTLDAAKEKGKKLIQGKGSLGDYAGIAAGVVGGGALANLATHSLTPRGAGFTGKNVPTGPGGAKLKRTGMWGALDDFELNPLRRIPGMKFLHGATKPAAAAAKLPFQIAGKGLQMALGSGIDDMAAAGRAPRFGSAMDDFLQAKGAQSPMAPRPSRMPDSAGPQRAARSGSAIDDFAQKPTKLATAIQKFQRWLNATGRGLKGAAGAGAAKFSQVFDEGLLLVDDVVKLAARTPGMGAVGQIFSIGFKKVIPGLAGAYMVGETIQDVWKIVKSDVPWLGDWKSLESYKAEAMGQIFGGNFTPLGGMTRLAGMVQGKLGLGSSVSDWQKNIQTQQKEKGILSSGKLMDAIIRGTTGIGGAALSTFFPGLGTLAGAALYEGGRYATTGINIPGIAGTVGGNVDKYGEAQDFSDQIIKAIEMGWEKGVPMLGVQ